MIETFLQEWLYPLSGIIASCIGVGLAHYQQIYINKKMNEDLNNE